MSSQKSISFGEVQEVSGVQTGDDSKYDPNQSLMYQEIVNDLHDALIKQRPQDIYAFCSDYFRELSKLQPKYDCGEEVLPNRMKLNQRRKSFSGVTFNPEKSKKKEAEAQKPNKSNSEIEFLLRSFKSIGFIANLEKKAQMKVIGEMTQFDVNQGDVVLRQGDDGDYLFVVESGEFVATITKNGSTKEVRRYSDCGYFGELALLHETPRQASVKCTSESGGRLWKLCRFDFKEAVCMHEHDIRETKINHLSKMELFENFTQKDFDKLSDALKIVEYNKKGEIIVEEGTEADSMYMILKGEVEYHKKQNQEIFGSDSANKNKTIVGKACQGDYFGELGLMERCLRQATVVTLTDNVRLLKLDADKFHRLMGKCIDKMNKRIKLYN